MEPPFHAPPGGAGRQARRVSMCWAMRSCVSMTYPSARAMQRLGIRQLSARSPQAKGRVERVAGTFQGRLVTDPRWEGRHA